MGNVLKYGLCSAIVCLSLLGCSAHTDGPGKIDVNQNQASRADSQPTDTSSPVPTDNEVAKVNTDKALARLTECMNRLTDTKDLKQVSSECFLSYPQELPTLYKMRSVSELSVSEQGKEDDGKISVVVSSSHGELGKVSFYYIESINQLKVVSSEGSQTLSAYGSNTIFEQAKSEAGL